METVTMTTPTTPNNFLRTIIIFILLIVTGFMATHWIQISSAASSSSAAGIEIVELSQGEMERLERILEKVLRDTEAGRTLSEVEVQKLQKIYSELIAQAGLSGGLLSD